MAAQHERIEYLEKELVEVREEGKVRDGELEERGETCRELEEKARKSEEAVVHIRQVVNIVQDELASKDQNVEKIQDPVSATITSSCHPF